MNVLVLNCYSRNALAVINGLGSSFNIIGAADRPAKAPIINPDKLFHSPLLAHIERHTPASMDEHQFIDDIAGICQRHDIQAIIPTGTTSTNALSRCKTAIEQASGAIATVEDYAMLHRVTDKWHTYELCREAGINVPDTCLYDIARDDPLAQVQELDFPIVLKPRISYASLGVEFVRNEDELHQAHQRIRESGFESPVTPAYIAQAMLDGDLHDVTACAFQGSPVALLSQQRMLSLYDFGGGGIINKTTYEPDALALARRFLEHTHWNGVLLFDFLRDRQGRFYLLECNPKIWGTTDLTIQAGANVARMLIEIFVEGHKPQTVSAYEQDLLYKWWFPECIYHWIHQPLTGRRLIQRIRATLSNYGARRRITNLHDIRHLLGIVLNRTQL